MAVVVLDEGPILHADIERYDDPGLDYSVMDFGASLDSAVYRLLLVDIANILETRGFAHRRLAVRQDIVNALNRGEGVPPIVVYRTSDNPDVFGLLDGVNRTFAHWSIGIPTIRAYELTTR
jgi:hypothetical protein